MPVFHRDFESTHDDSAPNHLQRGGPLIPIQVEMPSAVTLEHAKSQKEIPFPITGFALLDTGASRTCVDESVLLGLDLSPSGAANIATPSGRSRRLRYFAKLSFPDCPLPDRYPIEVTGVDLRSRSYIALIGRDLMRDMLVIYDGPGARVTFAF